MTNPRPNKEEAIPQDASLSEVAKQQKKKVAAKEWIAEILTVDAKIPIHELTHQVQRAVGLINQNMVSEWLKELKAENKDAGAATSLPPIPEKKCL